MSVVYEDSAPLLIGHSPEMARVRQSVEKCGHSRWPVLILGETGTGKEVVARSIHRAGQGGPFVVIDCSPSLSLMNQNALVFADSVLVPVACDYLSLVGVRQVIKTVKNVNALLHHPVQIWGVLPTFYDARAKICREAVTTLKQHFGERCLPPVRAAIKVKEAPAQGQTIFEYAEDSNAAEDYAAVVDTIVASRERTAGAPAAPVEAPRAAAAATA